MEILGKSFACNWLLRCRGRKETGRGAEVPNWPTPGLSMRLILTSNPAIMFFKPNNAVHTKIVAALHFDHYQFRGLRIGKCSVIERTDISFIGVFASPRCPKRLAGSN